MPKIEPNEVRSGREWSDNGASRPSRWVKPLLFRVAAVLLGLAVLALVEATLRTFDLARPTSSLDPFVGFSRLHPLFERDAGGVWRTSTARRLYFNDQRFPVRKPPQTVRIFCLGGSTVYGRPYVADTAFPEWLRLELQAADPDHRYEVVNCGGISYASYRLVPIVQEVLNYEPDLVVLATGHNEFLEDRTYHDVKSRSAFRRWLDDRLYSLRLVQAARRAAETLHLVRPNRTVLSDDVRARLDARSGYASYHWDLAWRRQVAVHFRHSLETMVRLCRSAGVPIVLVNLGCNLRDCPPFKSEHRPGLAPDDEQRWQSLFDAATRLDRQGDYGQALQLYHRAERIDDWYALLSYRMAKCLDRLGRPDQARRYYWQSKENDVCPLRILEPLHRAVFDVAQQRHVPVVDVAGRVEQESPDGIPGYDWYVDHVHPTVRGHQLLARLLAEVLCKQRLVPASKLVSGPERRRLYRRHLASLPSSYWSDGQRRVGWLENWSRRQRLANELVPRSACELASRAHRRLDLGRFDLAWQDYTQAFRLQPEAVEWALDHVRQLVETGRPEWAERLLEKLGSCPEAKRLGSRLQVARFVVAAELGRWDQAASLAASTDLAADARRSAPRWRQLADQCLRQLQQHARSG